ncbi:hypothetical protein SLEP1_g46038 [Rubroshorea leprosula]|uniref:Uncharacterized protein n=1 Tax=Rubroshorea leprosula TaxID=152421 RepID=A0AAV5LNC0_9ROSI|nr:hypothetical protein SLEP1_g46038 [Rubroshorea leprosula]
MCSSSAVSLDHQLPPSELLCSVHCNICHTVLAVSVPCTTFFKIVTVRCGRCTNLLPVNMRGLLLPSAANLQFHLRRSFFSPSNIHLDEISNHGPNFLIKSNTNDSTLPTRGVAEELPRAPVNNLQPPEKRRRRVPSAYNRFIKDEIQRIKAENPDISHREAFSAAAKNWAHFPHLHFGITPDQTVNTTNVRPQEAGDILMKD